ncbi:MAG TPA: DUF2092 domain-containing protein [Planctomycetota bacterium]|nr:DUF2092 domain-containing protein [Planctomycetota bacterium]
MRRSCVVVCCTVLVLLGVRQASGLPTMDEIKKRSAEATRKVRTYSSDMKMTMSMDGRNMTATGNAVGMKVAQDGKTIQKLYQAMTTRAVTADGRTMEMKQKIVNDGKYRWEEMRHPMMPAPMVAKRRADAKNEIGLRHNVDPLDQFEAMGEVYDFKVIGEETVGDVRCYVIEGTLKESFIKQVPDPRMLKAFTGKVKLFIGQDDMFPRRMTGQNADGQQSMSMDITNLKLNGQVDESLFRYTPPADAQVTDETGE